MSLKRRLAAEIALDGPITVADYMRRCLHDPLDGYYATRPALGAAGDFVTAPLVSQMFGEVLGAWAHEVWRRLGAPWRVTLVELGPGDGTLMSDLLRVAKADPTFAAACDPWLVETSGPLRTLQARAAPGVRWADGLADVPTDAPLIIIANEFLDCLPIRQAVSIGGQWRERHVGAGEDGALVFTLPGNPGGEPGGVREWSPDLEAFGADVGGLLARVAGVALFIDYGRGAPALGDTLQALRGHQKEHPLDDPGMADLTAHVDFPAFAAAAVGAGAAASAIETQGEFLGRLGIATRAAALAAKSPERGDLIARQLQRLVAPDEMGALFKVVAIASPGLSPP